MHINVIATRSGKAQPDAVPDKKADAADSNVETDTNAVANTDSGT